ncbi:gll1908 [Gloeobacter violaceus PCC 7421]|uniref:Gll1908 protein n=1 Tax=Gloeobacter violaceus (strain ATCC 29082 / PCC 7421) TaxID=251221 RepID=Q7NJC4_GLOVI|nr:gll1908 [Gloeobacter violaceus PCC 7421]
MPSLPLLKLDVNSREPPGCENRTNDVRATATGALLLCNSGHDHIKSMLCAHTQPPMAVAAANRTMGTAPSAKNGISPVVATQKSVKQASKGTDIPAAHPTICKL